MLPTSGKLVIARIVAGFDESDESIEKIINEITTDGDEKEYPGCAIPMFVVDDSGTRYKTKPSKWGPLCRCFRMMPSDQSTIFPREFDMDSGYTWLSKLRSAYCNICVCGKASTKVCSRCKERRYCSRECQAGDWESHKSDCIHYRPDIKLPSAFKASATIKCTVCRRDLDDGPMLRTVGGVLLCYDCLTLRDKDTSVSS